VKLNCREQAKYAVITAIDTFRFKPTKVPWEPKFIRRQCRPEAFALIQSYPGYTVARKWGLAIGVKQDDSLTTSTLGLFYVEEGTQGITMRVTNLAIWFHELCHAASYKQDWRLHQERFHKTPLGPTELEIEATLGAVALLYAWQLGTGSEVFWAYDFANKQAEKAGGKLVAFCEDLQPAVERQVAMILEAENE
jgi:hypothetical protein